MCSRQDALLLDAGKRGTKTGMAATLDTYRLIVTAGSQRGRAFALSDELTNIGRAEDNDIVLSDPQVQPHHATLARRTDRIALYVPEAASVEVDGAAAPTGQWVWLPQEATLKLSAQTCLQLQPVNGSDKGEKPEKSRKPARKSEKTGEARKTARFITDRAGETLVRFGEDGHLPELQLRDAHAAPKSAAKNISAGNPAILYAALGCSLLASLVLLFIDAETTVTAEGKAAARQAIASEFLGREGQPLQPYQRLLREANLAHSRGDVAAEHEAYRGVLRLLNSEDRNPFTGITGSPKDDERLRRYLGTLLSR